MTYPDSPQALLSLCLMALGAWELAQGYGALPYVDWLVTSSQALDYGYSCLIGGAAGWVAHITAQKASNPTSGRLVSPTD